jgi:3-methylfumaryl-CoA hydratase
VAAHSLSDPNAVFLNSELRPGPQQCKLAACSTQTITVTDPSSAASSEHLHRWIGRTEQRVDAITAAPLAGFTAMLDRVDDAAPTIGSALPPLAHWLYFLPQALQRHIGADGHPNRGGFLPAVPLPRRMWAGGRLSFDGALRVGDTATRRSTIARVEAKEGRSGPLVFVTVAHEISHTRGIAVHEEHDIVYRDHPNPNTSATTPSLARTDEDFSRTITPDPVLLFRYSALTFNGHRIHYDRDYVTQVEGYPGLVVHGPLVATLLLDLIRREMPNAAIARFDFTAASPLFDIHSFTVCGKREADGGVALWARNHLGHLAMTARAVLA